MNADVSREQVFDQTILLCVLVALIGIGIVGAILWFGHRIFSKDRISFFELSAFTDFWSNSSIRPNLPRYFIEALTETLQRRNDFWVTYGQLVVSILIIVILAILLITKTISAEAGLPLLSAVSGFAVAKSATTSRTPSPGPDREQ